MPGDNTQDDKGSRNPIEDYMAGLFADDTSHNSLEDQKGYLEVPVQRVNVTQRKKKKRFDVIAVKSESVISGGVKPDYIAPTARQVEAIKGPELNPSAYIADQISTDTPLNVAQKKDLQRLLDETLNMPGLEASVGHLEPIVEPIAKVPTKSNTNKKPFSSQLHLKSTNSDEACNLPVDLGTLKTSSILPAIPATRVADCVDTTCDQYRPHWKKNIPIWGEGTFEALLFKCRGVTLAIPLISLGHIHLEVSRLKKIPGSPSWVLGVKPLEQGQLKVIDAGAYFMPERAPSLKIDEDLYILGLSDCLWGFAVDSLSNPITVKPTDVQWRPLSLNTPWLAGAIKGHMCVLIDTPALLTLLG